jgi:hypothetical protein
MDRSGAMRARVLLTALLSIALAPQAADAEDPAEAALEAVTLPTPRPFLWRLPKGRGAAEAQKGLRGRVGKRQLLFVDVDGDGRFDEPEVDGWCIEPGLYLVPFRAPLIVETERVTVQVDAAKATARWSVEPIDAPRAHRYALSEVNELRMRNGLPPADYGIELSEGCRLHCLYCDVHGITHYEQKGRRGFTEAGSEAGRNGNIATSPDLDRVGVNAYATFFHRRTLMEPGTYEMGFGASEGHASLDGLSHKRRVPWTWPLIVPAPGTPPAGFPITLRWPPNVRITGVKARLKTKRGKKVGAHVSWMEKPAHASIAHNQFSICLIPKRVLEPGTTYTVEVEAQVNHAPYAKTFSFTTTGVRRR